MNQRTKKLVVLCTVILILFIAWVGLQRLGKVKTTLQVAPSTAKVTVDGKPVSGKTLYLSPKEHDFVFSLDNFSTVRQKIDVSSPGSRTIEASLDPNNAAGRQYLYDNPEQQQLREAIGSRQFGRTSDLLNKKYSFIDKLPVEGRTFSVNYGEGVLTHIKGPQDATIALYVDASSAEARRTAIYYTEKQLSLNPANIEFVFENYNNPFQQEHPDE